MGRGALSSTGYPFPGAAKKNSHVSWAHFWGEHERKREGMREKRKKRKIKKWMKERTKEGKREICLYYFAITPTTNWDINLNPFKGYFVNLVMIFHFFILTCKLVSNVLFSSRNQNFFSPRMYMSWKHSVTVFYHREVYSPLKFYLQRHSMMNLLSFNIKYFIAEIRLCKKYYLTKHSITKPSNDLINELLFPNLT